MIASRRMSDVAAAAGVATSTVSNVLNRPQKVKTETRVKILATMDRLGYVRNEQASELSDERLTSGRKHCGRVEPRAVPDGVRGEPHVPESARIQIYGSSEPLLSLVDCPVALVSGGRVMARGRIEMVTTDLSTAWVWIDGGKGRRMIHAGDGLGLMILDATVPPSSAPMKRIGEPQSAGIAGS
jgi:hypothetical protein